MTNGKFQPRLLVAGLGNLILSDDGVGVHAVRRLKGLLPKRAVRAEIGTAVLDALHLFERADRIIALDAVQIGSVPGAIHLLDARDTRRPLGDSLHAVDLLTVLNFLPGHEPEVVIIGAEPASLNFGLELSPAVAATLPQLIQAAALLAAIWEAEPSLTAAELCRRPRWTPAGRKSPDLLPAGANLLAT